jgi:hypothetical protein
MTREWLGLAGLDAGYLAVGYVLLLGLGIVRSRPEALRFAGLALVCGWAATGIAVSYALVGGLADSFAVVAVLWALLAGAGLLAAQLVPRAPLEAPLRETSRLGWGVAGAGGLLLAVVLAVLFRRELASGPLDPDAWSFWLPKAKTIFSFGGLDTGAGGFTSFPHADYPPLVPGAEATAFRFAGAADPLVLPVQHWVIAVGFLLALGGLLAGRSRPAILAPALAVLAMIPSFEHLVGSSLGDEPLLELVTLAGVCAVLWLRTGARSPAILAGFFLASSALTKNEGLMLALAILVALAVAGAWRRWPALVAFVAATGLALAPWRIWLLANDVHVTDRDYAFSDLVHPSYLGDRLGRLATVLADLPGYLVDPGRWLVSVPVALLLAAALVVLARPVAVFVVSFVVLAFLGYAAIFWIGRPEIHFYLDSAAGRITAPLAVLSAALLPVLLEEALAVRRPAGELVSRAATPRAGVRLRRRA